MNLKTEISHSEHLFLVKILEPYKTSAIHAYKDTAKQLLLKLDEMEDEHFSKVKKVWSENNG